jgi:hypothetical protein
VFFVSRILAGEVRGSGGGDERIRRVRHVTGHHHHATVAVEWDAICIAWYEASVAVVVEEVCAEQIRVYVIIIVVVNNIHFVVRHEVIVVNHDVIVSTVTASKVIVCDRGSSFAFLIK